MKKMRQELYHMKAARSKTRGKPMDKLLKKSKILLDRTCKLNQLERKAADLFNL